MARARPGPCSDSSRSHLNEQSHDAIESPPRRPDAAGTAAGAGRHRLRRRGGCHDALGGDARIVHQHRHPQPGGEAHHAQLPHRCGDPFIGPGACRRRGHACPLDGRCRRQRRAEPQRTAPDRARLGEQGDSLLHRAGQPRIGKRYGILAGDDRFRQRDGIAPRHQHVCEGSLGRRGGCVHRHRQCGRRAGRHAGELSRADHQRQPVGNHRVGCPPSLHQHQRDGAFLQRKQWIQRFQRRQRRIEQVG